MKSLLKNSNSQHLKDAVDYALKIKSGKILSGLYTKKAIQRFERDLKRQKDEDFLFEFKPDYATPVIEFAEHLFIPDLNSNLKLLPWMKFIYMNLFGWRHKLDNSRARFRHGYIEVARKNSKTTSILFPLVLYDYFFTHAAESFFVSADLRQSSKTFQELTHIFNHINKQLTKTSNVTTSAITDSKSNSFINFFSSDSRSTDSYKNSCSLIDEFHSYDTDKVITSFKYGGRARKNSLVLIITSAGTDISKAGYAENEKARKILNGVITDETYFSLIYAYDEKDDWKDKKMFIKANPSLGPILSQEILETDLEDAISTPSHQADFKAKTCGFWQNDISNWIPLNKWLELPATGDLSIFEGQNCYAGLDLSSVGDFSALTFCFPRDGLYYLFHRFYVPENTIQERYKGENINIKEWVDKGIVTATPGDVVNYDYIKKDFLDFADKFNIIELSFDKWNSNKLIEELMEENHLTTFIQFEQSLQKMALPTKEFERLVYEKKIACDNPVMMWHVTNATIKPDVNNNYKPLKIARTSTARIDGVISSIMAITRARVDNESSGKTKDFSNILNLF